MTGRLRVALAAGVVACVATVSSSADAQTIAVQSTQFQVGFTGGLSVDPEQGFVGVFWRSPEIGSRFHIRPGLDGGFGDHLRVATVNIDFLARFPIGLSGWDFIQGGGPAVVITRIDPDFIARPGTGGRAFTDVGAGGSYIIGFAHESGFLTEFRIGGGTVPNLKFGAGYAIAF